VVLEESCSAYQGAHDYPMSKEAQIIYRSGEPVVSSHERDVPPLDRIRGAPIRKVQTALGRTC